MLIQSRSTGPVWLLCFVHFVIVKPAFAHDISFGALIRDDDEEDLGSAVRTAMLAKGGNDDTISLLNQSDWSSSRIMGAKGTDAFSIGKTACSLINSGRKILLARGDWRTHSTLTAISEGFNLPFVNWASSPNGIGQYEIAIYPPIYYVVADLVAWKRWDRLIYVFDTESGIWNQRALIDHLKHGRNRSITTESVQLPTWNSNKPTPDYFHFLLEMHRRYFTGTHCVILDVERMETLKRILLDLQDVAMKTSNFHYIIASYGITWAEFNPFRNGLMNVSILHLLDDESKLYQHVQTIWRETYHSIYGKQPNPNRLSPRASLAYDSVLAVAAAARYIEKRDRYRYDVKQQWKKTHYCQLDDDNDLPESAATSRREGNTPEFCDMVTDAIKRVRTKGLTGNIEFDERGMRRNFEVKITSLEFRTTEDGPTGILNNKTWIHGAGVADGFQEDLDISQESIDLSNQTLKITTVMVDPFVMESKDYIKHKDVDHTLKTPKFEGYVIDLIELLSKKMNNFNYVIKLNPEGAFGAPVSEGIWNGMIGELISRDKDGKHLADMAVGPVTITRQRERVVHFSKPFMTTGISIMIKKPDKQEFSVFSFLQPLSEEVWMYIIFAYVGVSVVLFLISRFSPYEWRVEEGAHGTYTITNDFSIYNCLWFTLAAFMQQGTDILPRSVSGRIASSAWWFFTMIIVSSYTANLAAFLTMEKMRAPIESVDDLVKQTKIKYGIQRGGSTEAFFRDSPLQMHKRMHQFMETHKEEVMVKNYDEGITKVRDSKGTYAFLLEATANEYASTRKPCDTMKVAGGNLNSLGYGVATPFESPFRHRINLAILELQEHGELKRLENKWWYEKAQCEQGMADSQSASLTLSKVAGIFYILLGGMIFAMCAAFGEFFHRSRKQAKKNREGSITCRGGGSTMKLADPIIDKS